MFSVTLSVISLSPSLHTILSPSVLRLFLMNLRRCLWFMLEAAWMWVSTLRTL